MTGEINGCRLDEAKGRVCRCVFKENLLALEKDGCVEGLTT